MATISTGHVRIPAWVVASLVGVALTLFVSLSGVFIVMWRDVHDNTVKNEEQDRRIDYLEPMVGKVTGLDAKVDGLTTMTKDTNKKIDLLLGAQLQPRKN